MNGVMIVLMIAELIFSIGLGLAVATIHSVLLKFMAAQNDLAKRETLIDREAYAYITSATQKEFFAGGQIGLKPEIVAKVFFGDYFNEEVFSWNGDKYHVYRVFRTSDHVELYAERQKGVE